jgi:hypothetical protein
MTTASTSGIDHDLGPRAKAWIALMILTNGWWIYQLVAILREQVTYGGSALVPLPGLFAFILPLGLGLAVLGMIGLVLTLRRRKLGVVLLVAAMVTSLVLGAGLLGTRFLLFGAAALAVFLFLLGRRWSVLR